MHFLSKRVSDSRSLASGQPGQRACAQVIGLNNHREFMAPGQDFYPSGLTLDHSLDVGGSLFVVCACSEVMCTGLATIAVLGFAVDAALLLWCLPQFRVSASAIVAVSGWLGSIGESLF